MYGQWNVFTLFYGGLLDESTSQSFLRRKKEIDKTFAFFFRELFVNSIQNNPTRYTKRETYRSGVDGEPGASLGGSSGSLEVDLFVRATIHWCGEERGASVSSSVLLDWTSKEIDEKIRDQASSHPYGMKFQNPPPPSRVCAKKETTTKTRRLRPSVASSLASAFARDACAFSSRRGKNTPPRSRRRRLRRRRRWRIFRVCNPPFCLWCGKTSKKKKRKNPLVVPRFLRRKALSLEVSRPKTRPRCGGKRVGAYLGGELRGSNGGRQRKHFCICGVFVDVFCA